jgi:hypothetical protein
MRRNSRKIFDLYGSNLQNLEKSIRQMYIPDGFSAPLREKCLYWLKTGDLKIFNEQELTNLNVFVQVDQSGAEALIVAYLCRNASYRQLFVNNIKPHSFLAMHLFKNVWPKKIKERGGLIEDLNIEELCSLSIPDLARNPFWSDLDLVIKDSDNWQTSERYYYFAKQTCHSANYGIEENTFRMNVLDKSGGKVVISAPDAKMYLGTYRGLFPEIPEWNEHVKDVVRQTKMLYNLFGYPYQITNHNITDSDMKEYIAWGPQSTVGQITETALTNLQEYIESEHKDWDILADTHDSYLTQGPLLDIRDRVTKMTELMGQPFVSPVDGAPFNMRSEWQIGFNWSSYKKGKNEEGLQSPKWVFNN